MTYTRIVAFLVMLTLLVGCLCACGETAPQDGATTTTTGETQVSQSDEQTTTQEDATTTSVKESTTEKQETTTAKDKTTTVKKTATSTTKAETTVGTTTTTTAQTTVATTTTTKAQPITALKPLSPDDYYGYNLLKKEADGALLTQLYKHFVESVERMDATIKLDSISTSLSLPTVKKVWNYYQLDYPQHFWVDNGFDYSTLSEHVTEIQPIYSMTVAERDKAKVEFDAVVKSLLSKISGSWGEYKRELAVHDALCDRVTYRDDGKTSHNAYGALVNKVAVCEGYAEAFQYLMYQVGTQCLGVFGTAGKLPHKWNIVYIDGVYYDVDVTWDDPIVNGGAELVAHTYFNLSDAILFRDHNENDERNYPLPPCNSMDENYYVMQGVWMHDFSEEAIAKAIQSHGETVEIYLDEHTTNEFATWLQEHWKTIREMAQTEYRGYRLAAVSNTVTLTLTK